MGEDTQKIGEHWTHPAAESFPLLRDEDPEGWRGLVQSIQLFGLRYPIELDDKDRVVDGRNRYLACLEAGVPPRFERCAVTGPDEICDYVWTINRDRRHLEPGRFAACWLKLEEARKAEAKRKAEANRKRSENAKPGPGRGKKVPVNVDRDLSSERDHSAEAERHSRTELAKKAGVGTVTMQKAMTLGKEAPEVLESVRRGEVSLNRAYRNHTRGQAVAKIDAEPAPLPTGPFRVIVADPPWAYQKRKDDGTHRAALSYPDMTTDEICEMDVESMAHDDAILWLWTTNAFMRDAFQVLDAWGFQEKTILTWFKNKMGTGDWLRGKTEHCIMAVRGKPLVQLTNQTTALEGKVREHSRKPDEFYELVEALCPGSKVELFCREPREGWASWGAETDKFDAA